MEEGRFAINKNPNLTYVSSVVGKEKNIRYISKVFDLKDFKDFYYDQKSKKVFEVIRESSVQEITAIFNEDTNGCSIGIQRFNKETGVPHNQSFSFHGGALNRFIKFIESIDFLDLSNKGKLRFTDNQIDDVIEQKRTFTNFLNSSKKLTTEQWLVLFNSLEKEEKNQLFVKFIDKIDEFEYESLEAAIKQKEYRASILKLQKLIDIENRDDFLNIVSTDPALKEFSARQPEKIFHNWIEKNLWIFGVEYYKKHPFRKIGEDNSEADIVLETADGFLSLIEIKRPKSCYNLFRYDKSHRCYYPSAEFSSAIGQCLIYLQRIEDFKKTIENKHTVRVLRPKVRLIIGRSKDFNQKELEALHFINSSLTDIDVMTYDQLFENGNKIISYYS